MTIRVTVDLLAGRYAAHTPGLVAVAEWPPHPARLFSALVAGAASAGVPLERLAGLEQPPTVFWAAENPCRSKLDGHWQPDPDLAPTGKFTKGRVTWSHVEADQVVFDWPSQGVDTLAVTTAATHVGYFGRASTPAHLTITVNPDTDPDLARWEPARNGNGTPVRVPYPGMIEDLIEIHDIGAAGWAQQSTPTRNYRPVGRATSATVTAWTMTSIWRAERPVPQRDTLTTAETFRAAVLAQIKATGGDLLGQTAAGHTPDIPGIAVLPLPYVGGEHATGRILGVGVAIHRDSPAELTTVINQIGVVRSEQHRWNPTGNPATTPWTLQPKRWTGPATTWTSISPVVLHRPSNSTRRQTRNAYDLLTTDTGIEPAEVTAGPYPIVVGATRQWTNNQIIRRAGCRERAWVTVRYPEPVTGPILAGRTSRFGIGLFIPLPEGTE